MERDPRSNRDPTPVTRPQGAVSGGPATPLAPTSGTVPLPRRRPRRTGLNPWYFVLIGGLPILVITIMLLVVGGVWPPRSAVIRVPTPSPVWEVYAAFFGQEQLDKLTVDQGTVERDTVAGPGWFVVHAKISNNSGFDMTNVDLRAFFYDKNNQVIGSGIANVGHLQQGATQAIDIQAQLTDGPAPRNTATPTPTMPDGFDHYEVKIVAILPAPTPTK